MSLRDILREYGKWIESTEFARAVAKKNQTTDRQAYRKIKRAWKNEEIQRIVLHDRRVLYGLREWPFDEKEKDIEKKVEEAVKKFKDAEYTEVSLVDLANMVGAPPNKIEELAYRLVYKYGLSIGPKTTSFARSREYTERLLRRYAEERKKKS